MIWFRLFWACNASAGAPGSDHIGRLLQASAGGEHHLTEAPKLVVLGHVHGLRQADEHAFVLFSRKSAEATGKVTSVGSTEPVPQLTMEVTLLIWV